jgi:hypothetical protein
MPEHAGALMNVPFAPFTLGDLCDKFSPQVGFAVVHSVFRALRVIHSLGLAHADLSMGNILLMGDSDFPQACFFICFMCLFLVLFVATNLIWNSFDCLPSAAGDIE